MKEFNLEQAKIGKPVCTRDGHSARIICFDMANDEEMPIVALVKRNDGTETTALYDAKGRYYNMDDDKNEYDLMMKTETREGWITLYRNENGIIQTSLVYDTEQYAKDMLNDWCKRHNYTPLGVSKVTWEE